MSSHTRPWSSKLPSLHPLTLGTQNLGCDYDTTSQSVAVVREAMDAGVSLHTSHNYNNGQSLNILKLAFREAPSSIPPLIGKIYCYNAAQIRLDVEEILERLPIDSLPVGQLAKNDHREREIVEDIINEGPMFDALCELKDKGLVGHWTFEIFQKFGSDAQKALETFEEINRLSDDLSSSIDEIAIGTSQQSESTEEVAMMVDEAANKAEMISDEISEIAGSSTAAHETLTALSESPATDS